VGFNSLLFIPNDELSTIQRHPEDFASEVSRACGSLGNGRLPGRFNSFMIPYIGHADNTGVVTVGHNFSECILQTHLREPHSTADREVELIRKLADSRGYTLRKKPKRKTK